MQPPNVKEPLQSELEKSTAPANLVRSKLVSPRNLHDTNLPDRMAAVH